MKSKIVLWSAALFLIPLFTPGSQAGLLEVRVGGGITSNNSDDFDRGIRALSSNVEMGNLQSYNVDALLNIPFLPVGAGVRFERATQNQRAEAGGSFLEWDLNTDRLSLLVNYRIIDTLVYAGPIASVGMMNGTFNINNNGHSFDIKTSPDGPTYTVGAEAGVKLKRWILGAEAGYQSVKFRQEDVLQADLNLSGLYGKILLGVTLF